MRLRAVGAAALGYSGFENGCGDIPDELPENEVFTGGTISGNACLWDVRSGDAASLVLYDDTAEHRPDANVLRAALAEAGAAPKGGQREEHRPADRNDGPGRPFLAPEITRRLIERYVSGPREPVAPPVLTEFEPLVSSTR